MRALRPQEASAWCIERAVSVRSHSRPCLSFGRQEHYCAQMLLPHDAPRLVSLGQAMLTTFIGDDDRRKFDGSMLWITRWDIWSESIEQVGYSLVENTRRANLVTSALADAPATLFEPDEELAARVALVLPLVFQWDAYVIPSSGRHFFFSSHDGVLYAVVRNRLDLKQMISRFSSFTPTERCPPSLAPS